MFTKIFGQFRTFLTGQLKTFFSEINANVPLINIIPAALLTVVAYWIFSVGERFVSSIHQSTISIQVAQGILLVFTLAIAIIGLIFIFFAAYGTYLQFKIGNARRKKTAEQLALEIQQIATKRSLSRREQTANLRDASEDEVRIARNTAERTMLEAVTSMIQHYPTRVLREAVRQRMVQMIAGPNGGTFLPAPGEQPAYPYAIESIIKRHVWQRRAWRALSLGAVAALALGLAAVTPLGGLAGARLGMPTRCLALCSLAPKTSPTHSAPANPTPPAHHFVTNEHWGAYSI